MNMDKHKHLLISGKIGGPQYQYHLNKVRIAFYPIKLHELKVLKLELDTFGFILKGGECKGREVLATKVHKRINQSSKDPKYKTTIAAREQAYSRACYYYFTEDKWQSLRTYFNKATGRLDGNCTNPYVASFMRLQKRFRKYPVK